VEPAEIEIAIDELEVKVERLRALYEQFFMGIERIPPAVVHKDVERRVYVLRREQIRNTARRFKLQTIIQRYNTFQQYWMRILREIENGTYRRHVLRAERTGGVAGLLTAAERKRLGLPELDTNAESQPQTVDESSGGISESGDDAPLTTRSPSSLAPHAPLSPAAIRSQIERDLGLLLDDENDELASLKKIDVGRELDDPLLSSLPPPPPAKTRKKRVSVRTPRRSTEPPSSRRSNPSNPFNRIPDSVRTAHGLGPVSPRNPEHPPPTSRKSIRPDRVISLEAPRPIAAVTTTNPQPQNPILNRGLRLPAQSAIAGRGLPPPLKPVGQIRPTTPESPVAGTPTASPTKPESQVLPRQPASAPIPEKPLVENATLNQKLAERPRGLPNVRESVIPRSNRAPAPPNPASVTNPSTPRTIAKPVGMAPSKLENVDVEQLADKLRAARKQTQENSPVSVDALAKKLETTASELQKKHTGKRIDFDVVIKDGKAIIKPIVR
jgi:hypothetical protein